MHDKPHLSASQLDTFTRCGEAWRRRYIEGHKIPPGVAMAKGSTVHKCAEHNFRQKIQTYQDLPVNDFRELAAEDFAQRAEAGLTLTAEERSAGEKKTIGKAKDSAVSMAEKHATAQAPEYQPQFVEERITLALPGEFDFVGIVDLIDDKDRVVDFKTASRKFSQADVDASVQLTGYHAAAVAITGKKPAGIILDALLDKAGGVERQEVKTSRDSADIRALAARIDAVSKAIKAGVFPPAPPAAYWCSADFCGYHSTCPFVKAGQAKRRS